MSRGRIELLAERLVRSRITGLRKGSPDEQLHLHSLRVAERLRRNGYPRDVVLAGLLHDIVEDGGATLGELRSLGFSRRTVRLVDLASHDPTDGDKNRRWARMVERLRLTNDRDAWAVKICDLIDNLNGCSMMPKEDRRLFFLQVKAPVFLHLTHAAFGRTKLYGELVQAFAQHGHRQYQRILRGLEPL